jgi:hypothetical protein
VSTRPQDFELRPWGGPLPATILPGEPAWTAITLPVNKMPVAGDASSGLVSSAAPRSGVVVGGAGSLASGFPFSGVPLLVDLGQPFAILGALADSSGWSEKVLPLPAGSAGSSAHCQVVWVDAGGRGSPGSFSAKHGISITVQQPSGGNGRGAMRTLAGIAPRGPRRGRNQRPGW